MQAKRVKNHPVVFNMNKSERLNALISHFSNGNKTHFANMLGVKPQTISSWLLRDTYDIDLIYSICVGVSADWLLTGKGAMLSNDSNSSSNVAGTERNGSVARIHESKTLEKIIPEQTIPLYSFDATAGILVNADNSAQYKIGDIFIPGMPRCDRAIHITGDSMYPLLKSGDIIAFKEIYDQENIFWGEMYLLFIDEYGDEYITVKYVHKAQDDKHIKLVSENPTHAPREVERKHIRALALVKLSIRFNTMR